MARQEIILGTAPTGLGGDPPRTASTKINAMTSELYGVTNGLGTASRYNAQTTPKANSNELLNASQNGVGLYKDLRASIYSSGSPSDLFGTGFTTGFCSGGALAIPGLSNGDYGVLTVSMQYIDASGAGGLQQRFEIGGLTYRRIAASATAWTDWQLVGQPTVGSVVAGSFLSAIIEKGENGNGQWTKFADGTMIMRLAPRDTATIAANSFTSTQLTSPQALITNDGVQMVFATAQPYLNNDHYGVISTSTGGGSIFNAIVRNGPATAQIFKINITVIGKWKL